MRFLLSLAWRDLRASGRHLWIFVACLVLGVSAQHIQCLHVWPQGQATAAVVAPTSADIPAQASFAQVLQAVPLSPSSTGPAPATHTKD